MKPYDGTGRGRQISIGGGGHPIWAPDGRTIYYLNGGKVMAVEMTTDTGTSAGPARVLVDDVDFYRHNVVQGYDLSPDGRTFVMIEGAPEPTIIEIHVVQSWFEELKRLVPVK